MSKAAVRTTRGVDYAAQRAARAAAQREGKSLGEWLQGAIVAQPVERRLDEDQRSDRASLEVPASVFERLRQPAADISRELAKLARESEAHRSKLGRSSGRSDGRLGRSDGTATSFPEDNRREARRPAAADDGALRSERHDRIGQATPKKGGSEHGDDQFSSIEGMLARNEARRVQERDAVHALTQKMAHLETKLNERYSSGEHPIKGALARLEARLDIIGKRGAAEHSARAKAQSEQGPSADSVFRLEGKLNAILDALQIRPEPTAQASQFALHAAQTPQPVPLRRSLDEVIAEITRRQDDLEGSARDRRDDVVRQSAPDAEAVMPARVLDATKARPVDPASEHQSSHLDRPAAWRAFERTDGPFVHVDDRPIDHPGADKTVARSYAAHLPDAALAKIERRLEALAGRLDDAMSQGLFAPRSSSSPNEMSALKDLLQDLAAKIEAVRAPSGDSEALDALQHQVEILAERFDRSESGLSILPTLAASVRELFDQLDSTRASIETSAARPAGEISRIAEDDVRARLPEASHAKSSPAKSSPERSSRELEPTHRDVLDRQARPTLDSVHTMLDEVVDRLSTMETDFAAPRAQARSAPDGIGTSPLKADDRSSPVRPTASDSLATFDFAFRGNNPARDPVVPLIAQKKPEAPEAIRAKAPGSDPEAQRADFIAAARRAATLARTEPSMASFKRPPSALPADKEARAGLLAKSRDYVAAHKRPVLMGVAAILMVFGTIAIVQQTGLVGGSAVATLSDTDTPVQSARVVDSATSAAKPLPSIIASNELTPTKLPRAPAPLSNPIPGSDPIQTGSIPNLPAFAASGSPQPGLPVGLKAAADAGNGSAQYDLGIRYAEGRAVPRDLKLAAQWLEKAADQGVTPAQYRLASIYEKGLGVAQDKAKAKRLYTTAAEAGNPRAMHNLAVLLADGDGHPDYAGASVWFRKAAAYGVHDSQYNLAILLARGLGVQQSFVQSYQWFAIAAAQDDVDAGRKRDEVATKLNANELAAAKAFASDFRPKGANPAVTEVSAPVGGWMTGAANSSHVNSAKSKVSSL